MEIQEIRINGNKNEQTEIYTDGSDQIISSIYKEEDKYRYSLVRYTGNSRNEKSGYTDTFKEAEKKLNKKTV